MILSVRHNTRRCLTTFSVFILMSLQHEADNDTKCKGGSKRGDRTVRYDVLDVAVLLAQGFAKIVQRGPDLIGENLGPVFCDVENAVTCRVEESCYVAF